MRKPTFRKRGVSLSGYGLIVGLISVVALAAVTNVGSQTNSLFGDVGDALSSVTDGTTAGATATPVATPASSGFRYWGIYTDVVANSDNASVANGSFTEMQLFYDGSMQSLNGLPGSFNSTGCGGGDTVLTDGSAPASNSGFAYCDVFDVIIDLGSDKEVTQIGLAPQGTSPCYNIPLEVTVRGGNSPSGPFGYEETITIATVTGYGVCPSGWSPGSITSFTLP